MEIELLINRVGLMGQGVSEKDGNIYFVPGAVPGDRVRVSCADEPKKRYRDAQIVQVLSPSTDRVVPPCAHFGECGGCDWLHWRYPAQIAAKQATLQHVLERSTWLPRQWLPPVEAKNPLGYRNRVQLRAHGKQLGFYRKKTHEIIDIENCAVASPRINEVLAQIRARGLDRAEPMKTELWVRADGQVEQIEDKPHAAQGFEQVNPEQNVELQNAVNSHIQGAVQVLELYAGNGNLTFGYVATVDRVFAVDNHEAAISEGRNEAARRGFGNRVAWVCRQVDARLRRQLPADFRMAYDTLLLDPPRAGAAGVLAPLIHEGLKRVIYVSCSPVAFTKDVQCLREHYEFEQVQFIDMFPHTRHIEFVALFVRR